MINKSKIILISNLLFIGYANSQTFVIFGDSLSDIGQKGWHLRATYKDKNGSLNKLYPQYLDPHIQSSSNGGTNYAYSAGVILKKHTKLYAENQIDFNPNATLEEKKKSTQRSPNVLLSNQI